MIKKSNFENILQKHRMPAGNYVFGAERTISGIHVLRIAYKSDLIEFAEFYANAMIDEMEGCGNFHNAEFFYDEWLKTLEE